MTSTMHAASMGRNVAAVNRAPRKPVDSARSFSSVRPISLVGERMVRDFERGVSLRSLGVMYRTQAAVIEDLLRERLRALEAAMRQAGVAAAASACLLMGLGVWDVWEAARGNDVAVERAFRKCGRARKRGLEDGSCLVELRAETGIAA